MTTLDTASLHHRALAVLRESATGAVVLPGDPEYEAAHTVYGTVYGQPSAPALVVQVADAEDVRLAVAFARDHGLVLSVRSGGHSGSGFSTNVGGLVIDLRRLNGVEILDRDRGLVQIGAGAAWGDVATALGADGLAISSGDTVSVGVGGLTLGGGIGWMVRQHGLALDSLVEASVVTASGEQLRANADENADLFWALRGGGGNFGVVTSFTFHAQPLSGVVAGALRYSDVDLATVLAGWRDIMRVAPEELNTTFLVMPDLPNMPGGVHIVAAYAGEDAGTADAAIAPLRALPGFEGDDISPKAYADILEEVHPPEGMTIVGHNAFARELDENTIAAIARVYAELGGSVLMLRSLTGAFQRVPKDATAFGFRDSEVLLISVAFFPPEAPAQVADRVQSLWDEVAPHLQGTYAGFSSAPDGEDPTLLYPPANLARLVEIKQKYDPANLFRRNHNIHPDAG